MRNSYLKLPYYLLYIFLLLVAVVGIFGASYLPLLLLGGIIMGMERQSLILKKRLEVLILFIILILITSFIREDKLDSFNLAVNIFILIASILTSQIFYRIRHKSKYKLVIILNLSTITYMLITRLLGISPIDAVQFILLKSTYHMAFWVLFIFNAIAIIELSHKSQRNVNKNKVLFLSFLFAISGILLSGRSGIGIGILIFLYTLFYNNKRYFFALLFLLFGLFLRYNTTIFEIFINIISIDVFERGFEISFREAIWACYFENLTVNNILYGFDKIQVAGDCLSLLGTYDGKSSHIMTESSFLSLVSSTGILGLVFVLYLVIKSLILSKDYYMHFIFVLCLLFRASTGDYLFFSIYDFIFYILIFNYRDFRTTDNSLSRKVL